ncbi:MAG: dihydroorotate oxidase [Bacteroidota bacterium]
MISFSTTLSDIFFPSCILNASGALCTTGEELEAIGNSHSGAILTKSCTLEPRTGNPEPRYIKLPFGSINSMGIPNFGYKFYGSIAKEMKQYGKPYIVSVSGLTLQDNITIVEELSSVAEIDMLELNLSCPNIPGKPQVGYDFEMTKKMLAEVFAVNAKPLGVKLPPYFDFVHFEIAASILNEFPLAFVTCINSLGNGLAIDSETETIAIKPKNGFGGIGGKYAKPTALANVRKFYELLNRNIAIIGVGGIENGGDVFEFLLCGASAVQIGTTFVEEGVQCFERIENELHALMKKKNYSSINDVKGKLKIIE